MSSDVIPKDVNPTRRNDLLKLAVIAATLALFGIFRTETVHWIFRYFEYVPATTIALIAIALLKPRKSVVVFCTLAWVVGGMMTPVYSHSFRWMYLHLDEYLLRKLTDGLPLVVTMLVGIAAAHCWNWFQSRRQEFHRLKTLRSEGG